VKLSSPGPVFFRQKRYGLSGEEIRVWKFRSMRVCEDGAEVKQAAKDDDRITPIGRLLRKTSLDELPQLFNVMGGSMSLVGPRPHATAHNEQYRSLIDGYMLRHKVKPGITGLAQVNGWRGETETLEKMERRVEFDHRYIREWSLWMDVKILLKTALVVFRQENAY
jgi:putative colanic acid biosynthesis UDP-glucose lipid carrier transferase